MNWSIDPDFDDDFQEPDDYDDPVDEELLDDPLWGWDYGWGTGPEEHEDDE